MKRYLPVVENNSMPCLSKLVFNVLTNSETEGPYVPSDSLWEQAFFGVDVTICNGVVTWEVLFSIGIKFKQFSDAAPKSQLIRRSLKGGTDVSQSIS